ncbi:MAG: amidohydrolase family protein, partial [Gammaproteobacteria bacterium]|nr:amidohydrolase family protein [Gammaproteobacteria bacterium]
MIDATGYIVSPGFIDVHTHDDHLLMVNPEVTPKLSQGVTTVVIGNCGISLSPWLADRSPPPPMNLIGTQESYHFPTFATFCSELERKPAAINSVPLIGHSTLRCAAMEDLDRPAREREIQIMKTQLRACLEAGAAGFSTGLAYAPSRAAPAEEVTVLASELSAFGGIYATHMRNEEDHLFDALEETFVTARRAGCPVVISHHKCAGPAMRGQSAKSLAKIESAARQQPIGLDVYPYTAASTILMEEHIEESTRILVTWSAA